MVRKVGRFVKRNKEAFIVWVAIIFVAGGTYLLWPTPKSPVPAYIKQEVSFKVVYPTKVAQIDNTSWKYQSDNQIVTFNLNIGNNSATVTEQEVPLQYQDDEAAYDRFIGSLKPYANFNVPLGSVTLANFVTSEDFNPTGMAGILKTHGTLIIVHPSSQFSQDDWENLFNSLKVSSS